MKTYPWEASREYPQHTCSWREEKYWYFLDEKAPYLQLWVSTEHWVMYSIFCIYHIYPKCLDRQAWAKGLWRVGGWVRRRCPVAFVTGASNWYWLTVGQVLLSLQQVGVEGECYLFFSLTFFLPYPSHLLYYLFSLFSPFLWETTQNDPIRVDMSFNPNAIKRLSKLWVLRSEATWCNIWSGSKLFATHGFYLKYWDTLSTYHTCPAVWNSPFNYLLICLK